MVDINSSRKFGHFLFTAGSMYMFYTLGSSFAYEKQKSHLLSGSSMLGGRLIAH